ncbi:MAG: DUF515 domain-containing protein [Defluviitaleaceae bacterium]|nr:DUF515 domain-containing protein [Defluviitaleaceae bacterium]
MPRKKNVQRPKNTYNPRNNPNNVYNPTAHAYDYYSYEEALPQPQKKIRRRGKRILKRASKIRFVKVLGAKNQSLSVYFAIVAIFFVGLGAVVAGSNVTIQRNTNNAIRNQLQAIELSNSQLANQIAQARDIEEIEYLARNDLGMSEPLAHNIIVINIASERELVYDFTLPPQYDPTYGERLVDFFNNMVNFFIGG